MLQIDWKGIIKGMVPSTSYGRPWRVVLQIEVENRTEALILERKIKKRGAKRFIEDNLKK